MIDKTILQKCSPYSLISKERFLNNIFAVCHVESQKIEGDIVEIGVYLGGSMLAMMLTYKETKAVPRTFHLYDTFEGMTPAGEHDFTVGGKSAAEIMKVDRNILCIGHLDHVKANISHHTDIVPQYHVGDILQNTYIPEKIAVLRLDTDWYESTKHELDTFYDSVVSGGIVIIDDYGHWKGCKKAVDEFLETHTNIVLKKIDYSGVYFIKP